MLTWLIAMGGGCNQKQGPPGEKPVARFDQHYLTTDDLRHLIPSGLAGPDSVTLAQKAIRQWLEDHALEAQARDYLPDLDRSMAFSLRQYELDLVAQAYFQYLTETDPVLNQVTIEDAQQYYLDYPEKFQSERTYFSFFHVQTSQRNAWNIRSSLRSRSRADIEALASWCADSALSFKLDSFFRPELELLAIGRAFPYGDVRRAEKGTVYEYAEVKNDTTHLHYLKLLAVLNPGEIMPFTLCKDKIAAILVSQRKRALFEQTRKALFEQAEKDARIELYSSSQKDKRKP